jgi:two-component system phosphate regulon sensor histidine kinase PhoR
MLKKFQENDAAGEAGTRPLCGPGARIVDAIAAEIQTGALVIDGSTRVLYANPFLLKSFAVKGEVIGRPLGEVISDAVLAGAVEAFFRHGKSQDGEIEIFEGERAYSVRLVPLEKGYVDVGMAGGGQRTLLLFVMDMTEEKRVEAIKKDLVANVSHELRTPLASIKGYSETLLEGGLDDATTREFLRIIDKHATRMSRLIDDLLILSRLESHQMPIECVGLDLAEIIGSIATGFRKQAEDKGIKMEHGVEDGVPRVLGDRHRLEQVLVNLLDNAIKYTPSGGKVRVSARVFNDEVRVDVVDTGFGIPARDIPRIFERFYRVDKARSRELGGTGLGLAIAKHIIQGHGGRIWVESEPGKGSTFSFTLKPMQGA